MFVGEMGCWLVVGMMKLYQRYLAKPSPSRGGYQAVDSDESNNDGANGEEEDDEEEGEQGDQWDNAAQAAKAGTLRGFRILLLALPAICDICGTTLMNVGLFLVAASIFQMTRGALVLFVGFFSVVFLRRHLRLFQWLALVGVVLGVAVVGLAGAIWPDERAAASGARAPAAGVEGLSDAAAAVIGVLLIAGAQVFTATQFVLEEWILENSSIEPLVVVGWEGIFGFGVTVIVMIVMHLAVGRTAAGRYGYFDLPEGLRQMTSNKSIAVSSLLIMFSIG